MSQFKKKSQFQDKEKGESPLNNLQQSVFITEQDTRPIPVPVPQSNTAQPQQTINPQWSLAQPQNDLQQSVFITEQDTRPIPVPVPQSNTAQPQQTINPRWNIAQAQNVTPAQWNGAQAQPILQEQSNIAQLQNISTIKQETVPWSTGSALGIFYSRSPKSLQRFLLVVLDRVRDQQAEAYVASGQNASTGWLTTWGWLSVLALVSACGIALIAYAFANSRDGGSLLRPFLYSGLFLVFMPTAWRLITPSTSRAERMILLCIFGIGSYCIKVIFSPVYFSMYDEFLHWRTVQDIVRTGHLFTPNSLLPVSTYYSGIEIVTDAFSTLSGLDLFHSGLVVIGAGRLLLVLGLFALNERILQSARTASIATLIYMMNSRFIFFDAQFAYESLAIPVVVFMLFVLTPYQSLSARLTSLGTISPSTMFPPDHKRLKNELRGVVFVGCVSLITIVLTHHMTDFFLNGLLVLWIVMFRWLRLTPINRTPLVSIVLIGLVLAIIWINLNGNPVINYLGSFFGASLNHSRHLFSAIGTYKPIWWEQMLSAIFVLSIVFCLPFGMLCVWKHYRTNALMCTLGATSLFFIIGQFLRFTPSGIQVVGRSTGLVFIGVSPVLALFITYFWPARRLNWRNSALIAGVMLVVFLGGFTLEGGGIGLGSLPGPYEVEGDSRSIDLEGIQAALWAKSYLGSNNRVGADRIGQVLMGTYGNQYAVTAVADHIDVSSIFFSLQLDTHQVHILNMSHVRYLVVDLRLSQSVPAIGYYFTTQETDAYNHALPIPEQALTKFNTISQINRLLDGGDIVIYDVGGLTHATQTA